MCRKSIISLLLVITVATVFSFNSFATPQSSAKAVESTVTVAVATETLPQSDLTGTLVITGTVLVNGNVVQNGATVMSGSTVTTNGDSDAALDLGALGRINLRPSTEIRLILAPNKVEVELRRCGSITQSIPTGVETRLTISTSQMMTVSSSLGEVKVHGRAVINDKKITPQPEDVLVFQDESRSFDKIEEITAKGAATFSVNCGDLDRASGAIYAPYGWLVLLGLSAGVALGIQAGDNNSAGPSQQQATPLRP
jgi:hypothetical protein